LGQYKVSVGSEWTEEVTLLGTGAKQDFQVQIGPGFFNQTTGDRWLSHVPGSPEQKQLLSRNCGWCHSVWRLVNAPQDSLEDWQALVQRMQNVNTPWGGQGQLSPAGFEVLTNYIAETFTPGLRKKVTSEVMVRPTGEAARVVFTEWSVPPEFTSTYGAKPDSKGNIWFQAGGSKDGKPFGAVGRLDPRTGEVKTWPTAGYGFHDTMIDKQDNVWLTGNDSIDKFDTKTFEERNYDFPAKFGRSTHTLDFDKDGMVWFTINDSQNVVGSVVRLDPRTGTTQLVTVGHDSANPQRPGPYGIATDQRGLLWFTELRGNRLGSIDPKTSEVTEYRVPTPDAGPRRVQVDSKGKLWFTESQSNKIGMFDPQTQKFSEYDLPPGGQPYFMKIDANDKVWFNLVSGAEIGRFDPETKQFTFFPFPTPDGRAIDAGFTTGDPVTLVYGAENVPVIGQMYIRKPAQSAGQEH
jgi:virginiamycin B lyase